MQRHRHERVGAVEQFRAGARHPAAEQRREIEPVAILEGMHQRARDVVVAHRRAGALDTAGGSAIACIDRMPGPGS